MPAVSCSRWRLAAFHAAATTMSGSAALWGSLGDALQQLQDAAAPLLALLHPAIRDSLQRIGRTAEE